MIGVACLGGTWRLYKNTYGVARACRAQSQYGSIDGPLDPYLNDMVDEVGIDNNYCKTL